MNVSTSGWRKRIQWTGVLAVILLLASASVAIRATNLSSAWDIHVDEISYLRISENLTVDHRIELYDEPFYLHPPAYFFLQAAALTIVPEAAGTIEKIYSLRWINVVLGAFSTILVGLVAAQVAGRWAGVASATIFAVDPFAIRMNSQALLDTSTVFFALAGWAILISCAVRGAQARDSYVWVAVAAGLAFGIAMLTKEMVILTTTIPILGCFVLGWLVPRFVSAFVGVASLVLYGAYPLAIARIGNWPEYFEAKFAGLSRFAGTVKPTGFSWDEGPSLIGALLSNFSQYGTAYLIGLAGAGALVVLASHAGRRKRLLAVWLASSYAMLTFSVVFGTLEEQFFYYLTVPATIGVGSAGSILLQNLSARVERKRVAWTVLGAVAVAYIGWSSVVWYQIHFTPSNANERLNTFLLTQVPQGSRVSTTTEESQFLVQGHITGVWTTPEEFQEADVQYVVVSTRQTRLGYGFATPELITWLDRNAVLMKAFPSRTYGDLYVYRIPD